MYNYHLHFTLFLSCDLMRATIGCIRSIMAKEKTRGLKLILSYQLELNKPLLCSGVDLDCNDGTEKLNVLFICLYVM